MNASKLAFSGIFFGICFFLAGCDKLSSEDNDFPERELSEEFKQYWFAGEAEITSYQLNQSRYGENREGHSVLIFVTESFLPKEQVKANSEDVSGLPVMKLNASKKFNTGIYPYSIMESTFYPLTDNGHALKVSASIQEWCGHVYMQLNNRGDYEIALHSYFAGEADAEFELQRDYLENEVWTQLRINPDHLPTGEIKMIPSLEFFRMAHKEISPYAANAEFYRDKELNVYRITYPDLKRDLKIYFEPLFPFKIIKWEETVEKNGEKFTTTAVKMEEIKSAYWNRNSNKDLPLRNKLNL